MGRAQEFRTELIDKGSTMVNHSLNQKKVKAMMQGEHRFHGRFHGNSKKAEKSERKRLQLEEQGQGYESGKLARVFERVERVLKDPELMDPAVFMAELRYLVANGVDVGFPAKD